MRWPVMVDSLNLLGVSAVPITLLIDEYGIVRYSRPSDEDFGQFLSLEYRPADLAPVTNEAINLRELEARVDGENISDIRAYADALYLWGDPEDPSRAMQYYQEALELEPDNGETHFRLGVAYRKRFESAARQEGDFLRAVGHWESALEIDPNQYIWRRRIQQYGPRLDKPYSFYDWVLTARDEISARGETPIQLVVEPGGAEFADPAEEFQAMQSDAEEPDPSGRIRRDTEGMVLVETILVPHTSERESAFRVHLVFNPALGKKAHWNNEAGNMEVWVSPPGNWSVDRRHLVYRVPPQAVSEEERRVEFELRGPQGFAGRLSVPSYALYYVCEDVDGTCLYRRQDISIELE
jgi:tetratricopeptide (TPR) repeat protein